MNSLKRKDYKKLIKEFRKTCPLAQITNKWVRFTDTQRSSILMFVYESTVKRAKAFPGKYHGFEYGGFNFYLQIYGAPSLRVRGMGIDIYSKYSATSYMADKNCEFRVLNDDEVEKEYNNLFDSAKYSSRYHFKKKDL